MKIKVQRNKMPAGVFSASFGPAGFRVPMLWVWCVGPLEVDIYFPNWLVEKTLQVPEPCDCGEWPSGYGCPCDEAAIKWASCPKNPANG